MHPGKAALTVLSNLCTRPFVYCQYARSGGAIFLHTPRDAIDKTIVKLQGIVKHYFGMNAQLNWPLGTFWWTQIQIHEHDRVSGTVCTDGRQEGGGGETNFRKWPELLCPGARLQTTAMEQKSPGSWSMTIDDMSKQWRHNYTHMLSVWTMHVSVGNSWVTSTRVLF